MSCAYCNGSNRKPILSGWVGSVVLDGKKFVMYLRKHGGVKVHGDEARVRFCPMCGREL